MTTVLIIIAIIAFFIIVGMAFCLGEAYGSQETERKWADAIKQKEWTNIYPTNLDIPDDIDPDRFKTRFAMKRNFK